MLKLIRKDLLVLKTPIYWTLLYLLVILLVFFRSPMFSHFMYIMAAYSAIYFLIIGVLTAENKNQTDMFMNSLPITRREIILSKYLCMFTLALLILMAAGVLGLMIKFLPLPLHVTFISGMDAAIILLFAAFTLAIVIPMNLRFGFQAAQITLVIIFVPLFLALPWIRTAYANYHQTGWVQTLIHTATSQPVVLVAAFYGLILLLLLLSMVTSLRIYEARDF